MKRVAWLERLAALRPRERRLALVAGLVIGCGVFVSWVVQPLWDRMRDLSLHIEGQASKLEAFSRLLEQAAARDPAEWGRARRLAAPAVDESARAAFLTDVEALSRSAQVWLNLKPRPVKQDGRVSRFEVELDVEGEQERLLGFLDTLFRMPRLLTVERLRLAGVPTKAQWLRATLVIQQLSLQP